MHDLPRHTTIGSVSSSPVRELPPLTTPDGRTLTLCEAGAPDGRPSFYLHGTGSSRLEVALYSDAFAAHGLRLVAWDRPGSGGSTVQPGRRLRDVAADARHVRDALDMERPVAIGLSGGGSHVLALAATAGDVIRAAVGINPGGPSQEPMLKGVPRAVTFMVRAARDNPARWDRIGRQVENRDRGPVATWLANRLLDSQDRKVMARPEVASAFDVAIAEGSRQPRAYTREAQMLWAQPWGIDLSRPQVPVHVFAGERDPFRAFAQHLADAAGATAHSFPGGHVSALAPAVLSRIATLTASL